MAYKQAVVKKKEEKYKTPSEYGSHASMVEEGTEAEDGWIVLRDEKGLYSTSVDRLDTGLADPRRYNSNRVVEGTK